jgi:hypothetical protein
VHNYLTEVGGGRSTMMEIWKDLLAIPAYTQYGLGELQREKIRYTSSGLGKSDIVFTYPTLVLSIQYDFATS